MRSRLLGLIRKEFIQMWRDRFTLGMMLFMPMMVLGIIGWAINTDVKHMVTAVLDQSRTPESRELLDAFTNSQYFNLDYRVDSYDAMTRLIDGGRAKVGIVLPPDYARALKQQRVAQIQVIVDASDPLVATSAINAANAIGQVGSLRIASETLQRSTGRIPPPAPLNVRVRAWYNPDLVSAIFIIPGLLSFILMQTTITIVAMVVVRERERGTLEALIVSPLRRWELMIGKIVPNVVIGYAQMTFALVFGVWFFEIPIRGSLILLYFLSLFFIMGTLGLGILLSTIAKSQQQAMQMAYFIFVPSVYLSGVLFPIEGMPPLAKSIAYVIPLTYYVEIVRGIMLKGIGISYLWTHLLILTAIGVVLITTSILRFHKKLA
ncbi:MAG: ABC transporter permease [Candidatus Methylomirabilota bacterium]|nr:ABC transporter permease [candidate division NC10 bacterium]PWB45825.1 MAG: ABC transporter permease [candidate division NC10 bacterium]